jgi:16S rRNA processing protein RimM
MVKSLSLHKKTIMDTSDYYLFGYIKKTVDHQGEVIIVLDVDDALLYHDIKSFFIELPDGLIPFFVERFQLRSGNEAQVQLEGIDNEEAALNLKGKQIWLPLSQLPALSANNFYFHEVIHWKMVDEKYGDIGTITDIFDNFMQPLFQIKHSSGKEILIPLHDDILKKVDRAEKRIEVMLPEGLLEVYLS